MTGDWPSISVSLPTRIHLGLLDLSLEGIRVDGGIGLMLDRPGIALTGRLGSETHESLLPALRLVEHALSLSVPRGYGISLAGDYLQHVGLGSGTQIRLGLAALVLALNERKVQISELAPMVGRAGTSGIGSWGFWTGGYVVDAGHDRRHKKSFQPSAIVDAPTMPPLVSTGRFPWIPVIAIGSGLEKIHGHVEELLFQQHTPIPRSETLVGYEALYGGMLPSILERDFDGFCTYLDVYSATGFKKRELETQGSAGRGCIRMMREAGLRGVTMSSWGPCFVGFVRSSTEVPRIVERLTQGGAFLQVMVGEPSVDGARLSLGDASGRPASESIASGSRQPWITVGSEGDRPTASAQLANLAGRAAATRCESPLGPSWG